MFAKVKDPPQHSRPDAHRGHACSTQKNKFEERWRRVTTALCCDVAAVITVKLACFIKRQIEHLQDSAVHACAFVGACVLPCAHALMYATACEPKYKRAEWSAIGTHDRLAAY